MSRKGRSITLSVSERDKAKLEKLALEWGKIWGDRPNMSKLIEAIARGELKIAPNHDWSTARIEALEATRNALIDAGKMELAIAIAELMRDRSELSIPLRGKIEAFLENPPPPWRSDIERYLKRQQPFELFYQDATGTPWQFSVRHGQIVPHETRDYLDCWCEETDGNSDIKELQHNWCLRLDRIPEAAVKPIALEWRSDLDRITVEMHLFNRLALAYKPKPEDDLSEWLPDRPKVKRVFRSISNTFWFIREVSRYWEDCAVIAPDKVREKVKQKVAATYRHYQQ
ncbi:MAG: WYL domain-containing protein [Cyanobacteriota bacterium]|nr:WYL domain-containing protein [Cyanobacteriota bacterium]